MTTSTLSDLIAQRAALDAQIAQTQAAEHASAIQKVRDLMAEYGLTVDDLSMSTPKAAKTKEPSKVAAKYRDGETGATWSGRGLKPKWLTAKLAAGKKIEDFAV